MEKDWIELAKVNDCDFDDAYVDEYGVKYSKDRKRLLNINPELTSYTVPDSTEVICELAFTYSFEEEQEVDGEMKIVNCTGNKNLRGGGFAGKSCRLGTRSVL